MQSKIKQKKVALRAKRKKKVRGKIFGTVERPRLSVFRSLNQIYAQIIDDTTGKTLVSASSTSKELKDSLKNGSNVEAAKKVGELLAKKAADNKVTSVSFDRNGYLYHGRVKALADSAREAGLKF
jgi:large subunit ribosomal protein L18